MIYTITTNPSLDYYLEFDEKLASYQMNRSKYEMLDAGGKGVNVSIFLNAIGINSTCLGFLGGFTKDFYLEKLSRYKCIQPLFTNIADNTRINIKLEADEETFINAKGPIITSEEFEQFKKKTNRIFDTDSVVLSGHVQPELSDKIVDFMTSISKEGCKVILDTNLDIIERCKEIEPYVIKLNETYAGENQEDIIAKAKHYIDKGAHNVLYSSRTFNNYYLISKDYIYKAERKAGTIAQIGSGDAMIAGFLYSRLRGANHLESFKYAVAASKTLNLTDNSIDKDELDNIADSIEISQIK